MKHQQTKSAQREARSSPPPSSEHWVRARFRANDDDYRPVKWPPPGPYWCSGYGDGYSIVIAYVRDEKQITEYWPEASDIDAEERSEITYTDRFPKPEWYAPNNELSDGTQ